MRCRGRGGRGTMNKKKETSHPEESDLKLYCHALYHRINLKLYLPDNRLKMCHDALYHQINLKLHLPDNRLKMCHNALYHQINLKLFLLDNRLKMCHNALYHPINLKLKHHPQHHNQYPSLQSSPFPIMFLWQLDKVASILMHNS